MKLSYFSLIENPLQFMLYTIIFFKNKDLQKYLHYFGNYIGDVDRCFVVGMHIGETMKMTKRLL